MKTIEKHIDQVFHFSGKWELPSKCGIKIIHLPEQDIVIVSELYKENPGTSVTQAAVLLAEQICIQYRIDQKRLTYIEHNPAMNSKLSFYDEDFYLVNFDMQDQQFTNPQYRKLTPEEVRSFIPEF